MELVILSENLTYKSFLKSEHGFCCLIEYNKERIMFDTGAGNLFYENALNMNIDLSTVDYLILSHSHYDHSGGVEKILELNPNIEIITGKNFFQEKYNNKGIHRGVSFKQSDITNYTELDKITEILDNVYVFTKPKIVNKFDTHYSGMYKKVAGEFVEDDFEEEIFLCIKKEDKILLINGCAHNGISNAMLACKEYFGKFPSHVLGGCHMYRASKDTAEKVAEFLVKTESNLHLCHCTGVDFFAKVKSMTNNCYYATCGSQLSI